MIPGEILNEIEILISSKVDRKISVQNASSIGGGCINQAYKIKIENKNYFLKYNKAHLYPQMFESEAKGLEWLSQNSGFTIPEVICFGNSHQYSFILLQYIESCSPDAEFWENFGFQLGRMHKQTQPYYGLDYDNYIGSLPQSNRKHDSWIDFYIIERLEIMIKKGIDKGLISVSLIPSFERLYMRLESIFPKEPSSLLHGDLWSGNYMVDNKGNACLYDPAIYYGHREMDIGMTKLFGGFPDRFYSSYNQEYPLEIGWQERLHIHNLYPLLVHVNLFGAGYLASVKDIVNKF